MLTLQVNENSTAVVTISLVDSTGTSVTPDTIAYQVQKLDGTIINSRNFASGSFTGSKVVLSGDDLTLTTDDDPVRVFAIQGTYSSSDGTGLPFTAEQIFYIDNMYSQS